ncbi:MAG: hypothetical protein JWO30_2320 [Fibrobacteres bacterium]|nr:hypothetical protein [Fibrobacterota bacterium]
MDKCIAIVRWAGKSWPISIPVLFFAFPSLPFVGFSKPYFTYVGTFLEVTSVVLVIIGVDDKLKAFGKPGLVKSIQAYFRAFPRNTRPRIVDVGAASTSGSTMSAMGHRTADIEKMPISEAISFVYQELNRLREQSFELIRKLREDLNQSVGRAEEVSQAIQKKIDGFYARLEALMAGNYKLELCAALFLVIGILYNSLSEQMVEFYK